MIEINVYEKTKMKFYSGSYEKGHFPTVIFEITQGGYFSAELYSSESYVAPTPQEFISMIDTKEKLFELFETSLDEADIDFWKECIEDDPEILFMNETLIEY